MGHVWTDNGHGHIEPKQTKNRIWETMQTEHWRRAAFDQQTQFMFIQVLYWWTLPHDKDP